MNLFKYMRLLKNEGYNKFEKATVPTFLYIFVGFLLNMIIVQTTFSQQILNSSNKNNFVFNNHDSDNIADKIGITQIPSYELNNIAKNNVSFIGNLLKPINSIASTLTISVVNQTNTNCEYKNGAVTLAASNGIPPYRFAIDGYYYQPFGVFYRLWAGIHEIYVQDASGAVDSSVIVLTNIFGRPTIQHIFNSQNYPSGCNSYDGSFSVTASGGTPPYQYSYDLVNFQSSPVFTNMHGGNYNESVKDANGCIATDITLHPFGGSCQFSYSFGGLSRESCTNEGRLLNIVVFGGAAPYKYSLDSINFQQDNNFYNLAPGLHILYAKDATGLIQSFGFPMSKNCDLYTTATKNDAYCGLPNGSISLSSSYGIPPYSYSIDGINFQSSNLFSGLPVGFYPIITKDAAGTLSYLTIEISGCPIILAAAFPTECKLKTGSIRALTNGGTTPYSYSIDGVLFQSSSVFSNLAAGSYTVTSKDNNGFKDSVKVEVVSNACFTVSAISTGALCSKPNGVITVSCLNGTPPYSYSLNAVTYQSDNTFTNLNSGIYTVYAKDNNNLTDSTIITVKDSPAPLVNTVSKAANCLVNDGTVLVTITGLGGAIPPYQVNIDGSNNEIVYSSLEFMQLAPGSHVVNVKDANNCLVSDTAIIIRNPSPVFNFGNDTSICAGQKILLNAPAGFQYKYLWQDNSTENNYIAAVTGQYTLKVTNQFNCSVADTINIIFKDLPLFSLGSDTSICTGKILNINVPLTNVTYLWNTGSNLSGLLVNRPGLFWLKVTDGGCSKTDSISVTYKPSPIVNLSKDTTLCETQTLQLSAGNTAAAYLWQDNSTASNFLVSKDGIYSVSVNKAGCIVEDTINVAYILKPRFSLGPDQLICQGQTITLQPSLNQNWQLRWQEGSSKSSIQITQPGLYSLAATNTCGTSNDEVLFTKGLCKVYIPNAFSPNGDSKNDVFKVYGTDALTDFHLQIFNRYGQLIFESIDKNKGWDGKVSNTPAVNGNYVYIVQYKETGIAGRQVVRGSCLLIK